MKTNLIFYKSFFKWRWRLKSGNGKIIGASSESFWNKIDCEHNAELVAFGIIENL